MNWFNEHRRRNRKKLSLKTFKCPQCNKLFEDKSCRKRVHCSFKCNGLSLRVPKVKKTCKDCKHIFLVVPSHKCVRCATCIKNRKKNLILRQLNGKD